jgi:hypothetical protein
LPGDSRPLSTRILFPSCWMHNMSWAFHFWSVARHKLPTVVILSCFFWCAKFGPNRTIDIQDQNAHI